MTSDGANDAVIDIRGVTKRFRDQTAVDDLSLSVPKGTALGFIGRNGAGKTTTIKLLMGLLPRSAGEVRVLGVDPAVDAMTVRSRVGYVPEEQHIHRWMRVREAVEFCRAFFPAWDSELCARLFKLFDLPVERRVSQLSKGMVVKLSLLLALCHEPEVLILDEPMAGLDPVVREELLDGILQTLCDRDVTVLFSSHTLADVQRLADSVAIIDAGRLLAHRRVDELLTRTKRLRVVFADGAAPGDAPDGLIWQRMNGREWVVTVDNFTEETVPRLRAANQAEHVEVIDLGLEDIFKDYVRGRRATP